MANPNAPWEDAPAVAAAPWEAAPPVVAAKQAQAPSPMEALGRGAVQGATLGFGDELWGAARALGDSLPESMGGDNNKAGFFSGLTDRYKKNRDEVRANNKAAEDAHGGYYLGGNLAGGLVTAPFMPAGEGATLLRALRAGATLGAAQGLGSSESKTVLGDVGNTALGGVLGGAAGALGFGAGKVADSIAGRAGSKVAAIQDAVGAAGKDVAAGETATGMSAAGRSAQEAYKPALEWRYAGKPPVEPSAQASFERMLSEYDAKGAAGVVSKEARKIADAEALRQLMASEEERAKQYAADKLSGAEFKRQVTARALRYGLPAVGGAAYQALTGDHSPMGMLKGAGLGGLAGAGMRPMMHSMIRLGKQPVVQNALWRLVQGGAQLGEAATPGVESMLATEASRLEPQGAALLRALAQRQQQQGEDSVAAAP